MQGTPFKCRYPKYLRQMIATCDSQESRNSFFQRDSKLLIYILIYIVLQYDNGGPEFNKNIIIAYYYIIYINRSDRRRAEHTLYTC